MISREEQLQRLQLARVPKPKKIYKGLAQKSPKKIAAEKKERERLGDGDTDLQKFYRTAMKRMTGYCLNCPARTETKIYEAAIFSICHLLDKRKTVCPSVKDHPCNWVELCPSCHQEFDTPPFEKNKTLWDKREEMGFWNVVRDKLILVYPDLAVEERRFFPESVLRYMEKHSAF